MELKKTPFYQRHIEAGGRIVDFGGWALPVEYKSILTEAKACRATCGLFDASHMGEIRIRGGNTLAFLQRLISNDLSFAKPNQMQYNLLLNANGGVIDDLMVYAFAAKNCVVQSSDTLLTAQHSAGLHNLGLEYLCVVNASNSDKCFAWFNKNRAEGVEIINESGSTALLCLQGPNSAKLLENILGKKADISYMHSAYENICGREVLVSRSGYTGEDGFEFYCDWQEAPLVWDVIVEKGKDFGLALCGLGARDVLRIEAGYPLYGHEIDDIINPLEASLSWAVKLDKDFIGKEAILEAKNNGLEHKRIGFIMQQRAVPRQGYGIYFEGKEAGRVSSGIYSPNLDKFIGMGFLNTELSDSGTIVDIKIRDKFYEAKVAKFPFIEPRVKK